VVQGHPNHAYKYACILHVFIHSFISFYSFVYHIKYLLTHTLSNFGEIFQLFPRVVHRVRFIAAMTADSYKTLDRHDCCKLFTNCL